MPTKKQRSEVKAYLERAQIAFESTSDVGLCYAITHTKGTYQTYLWASNLLRFYFQPVRPVLYWWGDRYDSKNQDARRTALALLVELCMEAPEEAFGAP